MCRIIFQLDIKGVNTTAKYTKTSEKLIFSVAKKNARENEVYVVKCPNQ